MLLMAVVAVIAHLLQRQTMWGWLITAQGKKIEAEVIARDNEVGERILEGVRNASGPAKHEMKEERGALEEDHIP